MKTLKLSFSKALLKAKAIGMSIVCVTVCRKVNKILNNIIDKRTSVIQFCFSDTCNQDQSCIRKTNIKAMKSNKSKTRC